MIDLKTEDARCNTSYDADMFEVFIELSDGSRLYFRPTEYYEYDNDAARARHREEVVADVNSKLAKLFEEHADAQALAAAI